MADPRSVIERGLARAGSESYTLELFYRRRDAKRARKRFTAGIVGLAIAVLMAVVGSAILRSAPEDRDVGQKGLRILREGEVLQLAADGVTLIATDPSTGHQRILHRCDGCGHIGGFALSAERGWVAYDRICGGCSADELGIWVVGADRSAIRVTSGPWVWAWSPTREQLAFVTGSSGPAEIVLFDPATGERISVATDASILALSWSPDGTAIAIASSSGASVIDLESGGSTSLGPVGEVDEISWSPDGTRLVFDEFLDDRNRIIVVNADGSGRRVLLDQSAREGPGAPAWSPDGTRIAYVRTPLEPDVTSRFSFEVWVIGVDGSDPMRLFRGGCCISDWSGPVWSPDGTRLAFFDDVDVPFGSLLVVNADGTGSPEQVDDVVVDGWIQG